MYATWHNLPQAYNDLECCDKRRRMSIAAQALNDSIPVAFSSVLDKALYKALRPIAQPRFDTVSRVCAALGVRLVAQPVQRA